MTSYPFRSALVTGASSGIGEAMTRELAAAGVPTVVVARRQDRLDELADELDGIEVLAADLTDAGGQATVVERVRDGDAPVELVVNNAGFGTSGRFHELDADRLADEIELNIAALTRISNAAISAMVPRGVGWLLNVSSVASFQPAPDLAVYAATKAYVTSLSESLHEEVKGSGINVTALCPGLTRTEFQSVSSTEQYVTQFPRFLWTTAEDVARTGLRDVAANRTISVPGTLYKAVVGLGGPIPRGLKRRLSGLVQRQ
ncbi:MAG: SDR family oxidoreductase [Ilumatobacter sp.]|uniref:SDR family NAD(P)-dependent oxidoreductase n=1 Tax=Ilumatobacter sp. TaxID=1967498 RepID=UPI0026037AE5|nr:SDR family oxidoreductase [Ilumatobacter sp.]MDJ0768813.1 SDR family oxidoreductase [Ilumatobacter sp.]